MGGTGAQDERAAAALDVLHEHPLHIGAERGTRHVAKHDGIKAQPVLGLGRQGRGLELAEGPAYGCRHRYRLRLPLHLVRPQQNILQLHARVAAGEEAPQVAGLPPRPVINDKHVGAVA